MTDPILNIQFTDSSVANKNNIVISATESNTSTSLRLHGIGSLTYCPDLWGNMVKLLEHFCSDKEPSKPTEGQLWYKPSDNSLNLRIRKNNAYYWQSLTDSANSLSTDNLNTILSEYLNKNTPVLTRPLVLPSEYTNNNLNFPTSINNENNAATRKYVDKAVLSNAPSNLPYINSSVDAAVTNRTMLNALVLPSEFRSASSLVLNEVDSDDNANNAVTRRYVNEKSNNTLSDAKSYVDGKLPAGDNIYDNTKVVLKSGSIMSGQLILPRYTGYDTTVNISAGDNRLLAASREYVDDKITNNNANMSTVFTTASKAFNNTDRTGYFKNPTFMDSLLTQWTTLQTSTDATSLQTYTANGLFAADKRWMISNDTNSKIIRIKLPQAYTSILYHCSLTLVNPSAIIFEYSIQFVELENDKQTIKCILNHNTGGLVDFPVDWGIMVYTVGV
jgi:hypothetical protein